jgi:hypothetical protein
MEEMNINFVAILVTVVANFILGFLWYTPLFGKAWAKENGFDTTVKPAGGEVAKGMIFMVIGNLFMAYAFASNMMAWSFVPGMDEMSTGVKIFNAAFFTWLGFYLPVDLSAVAWEKKSWKLFFINTGYHLTMLLVAAVILTFM